MNNDGRFYELPDRDQVPLFGPSMRQAVANEPDVLALDAAVEKLDFSDIEAEYTPVGAPGYPPKVLFKVLVYGYSLGLRASRDLDRACRMDLAFRFLAHGLEPDFRTLCRFRRQNAKSLEQLFAQTVQLCREAGLVSLGHVAVDGTKVRANRGADTLAQALRTGLLQAETADADIAGCPDDDDEECRFMKTPEGIKPAYNAQVAVDSENQVIVAQAVTAAPADQGQLPDMVHKVKENCKAPPEAVSADGGYYTHRCVEKLEGETQVHLPVPKNGSCGMEWVESEGALRCPAGKFLRPYRVRDGKQIYRTHRCAGCALAGECGVSGRFKEVHVPVEDSAQGRLARRMASDSGQAVYAARKRIVEPVFAWMKHNRGFRRFLLRGRLAASAEWSLLCIAHNLGKWAQAVFEPAGRLACQGAGDRLQGGSRRWFCFFSALCRRPGQLLHLRRPFARISSKQMQVST